MTTAPNTNAVTRASAGILARSSMRTSELLVVGRARVALDMRALLYHTGHEQAQLLARRRLGVERLQDMALVHHRDAIGQAHDLVQFRADEQYRCAFIARLDDALMDELDAPHVQPAR